MKFTKMHGLGNDYIYIDCMDGSFGGADGSILNDDLRISEISKWLSHRHFGIGGDGLVMIMASECADFRMRIFNADGSEAKMCGNATRCIGKYVYDKGYTTSKYVTLETLSGIKYLTLSTGEDGLVDWVSVDMGTPDFVPASIPVNVAPGQGNVDIPVMVEGDKILVTAVSMGNPHGVVFVDNLDNVDVHGTGRRLEVDLMWPDRANIEFAQVLAPDEIRMRVWERGSGETMACGTGACACAVAAMLTNRTANEVTVHLLGGDLNIRWNRDNNHVYMSGGATLVFAGEVDMETI